MAAGYDSRMWWWWWLACVPDPGAHDCDLSGPHVVVATSDFVTGALAAVTPDGCVADRLVSTGGDVVVRTAAGRVWVLQRTGGDTLTAFDAGDYGVPAVETVVAPGGNAHDLAVAEGRLFLSLYDADHLMVLDLDGQPVGEISLSAYADADGLPEADALVVTELGLFLALQRLDRDAGWVSDEGRIVRIDPVSLEVVETWVTGPNPRLSAHPDGRGLVAATGHYFEADGALELLWPDTGLQETVLPEAGLQLDLGTTTGDVVAATGLAAGADSVLARWSDVGGWSPLETGPSWYVEGVVGDDAVWMAVRPGFADAGATALLRIDGAGVEAVGDGFALPPFSVAWVP